MLTNNKKRSFVKLLALTLAALMVFSVCLTGCTDEDARTAAQNAQNAADAAQSAANAAQSAADAKTTAEAVAAQITEALKPYLKADAAMTEADVKSAIENALTGYQAKGDYATKTDLTNALKDYMKSSEALTKKAVEDMLKSYQAKGDYATKSDLTAALKDYAKSDDVTVAVANYITKTEMAAALESFAAFAKSEDLSALSDALTDAMDAALTADDVADLITEALVDYATTAYVDEAIAAAKEAEREITTAEIADAIQKALADYDLTVQDRLDALEEKLVAQIESYFVGYEPAQVVELLKNVDKAMNSEEWAAATILVTKTLEATNALFTKVVANHYTQENKAEINRIMGNINGNATGVVIFKARANGYLDDAVADTLNNKVDEHAASELSAEVLTNLTVFILRAATVAEINNIKAAIDAATAVPTYVDEINAWRNDLYKIGALATHITNKEKVTADTWGEVKDDTYHGVANTDKSAKKAQVATAANRAAYDAAVKALEEMVVEYMLESLSFGTSADSANYGEWKNSVKSLYAVLNDKNEVTGYEWKTVGSYKGEVWNGVDVSALTGTTTDKPAKRTFVGIFAGIDAKSLPAGVAYPSANDVWAFTAPAAGWTMAGYYDNTFLDPQIKVDLVGYTTSGKVANLLNKRTPAGAVANSNLAETYAALAQMIADAEQAITKANELFTGSGNVCARTSYLKHIGFNEKDTDSSKAGHQCGCTLLTDAEYVAKLMDYMVEQTESDATLTVPADWATSTIWLTPVFDVTGDVAPWNYKGANEAQANTVDVYFNYAHNINGTTWINGKAPAAADVAHIAINNYPLYLKLVDQAWKVLYNKYKSYAAQILVTMRNDFRIAAKAAVESGAVTTDYTKAAVLDNSAKALNLVYNPNDIVKAYTKTTATTKGFLDSYYAGDAKFHWTVGNNIQKQIGESYALEGLSTYYLYNKAAQLAAVENGAVKAEAVVSDVLTALAENWLFIEIELDAVTVGPRDEILNDAEGEFEAKKATIGRVQDAFNAELKVAMANLEEIMYRYMYKEINDYYLNYTYASINTATAANVIGTADDIYTNGVATYFANYYKNGAAKDLDKLTYFMQVYVTGYAAGSAYAESYNGYNKSFDKDSKLIGVTTKDYAVSYPNSNLVNPDYVTVTPAAVYNQLKANTLTAADFAVGTTIEYPATAAVANAKAIYDAAINEMANAAVKFRFDDFIEYSTEALNMAYDAYKAVLKDRDQGLELAEAFNEATRVLTIAQYYSDRGMIADNDYLNTYVSLVLGTAVAYNSNHITLIKKDTDFKTQLLATVLSAAALDPAKKDASTMVIDVADLAKTDFKKEYVANKKNDKGEVTDEFYGDILVVVPQSPRMLGTPVYQNYFAIGSAIVDFDKILNATSTNDAGVSLYK